METLWFWLVALMLAGYVVFDGFDLGTGIVHLYVARDDDQRRLVLRSIGPVWDGNEVWLLAAGGTLYFAFPRLYASSFSGFYLPLMIVLWLLILRGCSIEFRHHVEARVWKPFWDVVFSGASLLLAIFLGAALGNVVRGVPLGATGYFFLPLWENLRLGPPTGIIDWYTLMVGLLACLALMQHGALWVAHKTGDPIRRRARRAAAHSFWGVLALTAAVTFVTFRIQPQVTARLEAAPWGYLLPTLAIGGLAAARLLLRAGRDGWAFLASCLYLCGMLLSAAFGLYPYVLPSNLEPRFGLTAEGAAAAEAGLRTGLAWWIPGMLLVAAYFTFVYRRFRGRVRLADDGY
jgi:cytochrome d ubiquinol oxidase subunit II